jgi:GNAT superfamily N-acetyltransferase
MRDEDLPAVNDLAAQVHPNYPEDPSVFAERVRLFAAGCFLLSEPPTGYILSHPWRFGQPPALNSTLGRIPKDPDTYYIHDIALLPAAQGQGSAGLILEQLGGLARSLGLKTLSLVAVNNSAAFWEKRGFRTVGDEGLTQKLASYDSDARFMVLSL